MNASAAAVETCSAWDYLVADLHHDRVDEARGVGSSRGRTDHSFISSITFR